MDKKILLIGAGGFLGSRLMAHYGSTGQWVGLTHADLDMTDMGAVRHKVGAARPDVVVLTAALSDTGFCARHPERSRAINLDAACGIAQVCREVGAKLVYMSSDQVYNGCPVGPPLDENTPLQPQGPYACHKRAAEEGISALLPDAVGLRLTWLYDAPDGQPPVHRHVLLQLAEAARSGQPLRVATHDHRGLTSVHTLAERLPGTFNWPGGVYNFGCGNTLNAYETTLAAARMWGLPHAESLVQPDDTAFAPTGRNLTMSGKKAAQCGVAFPDTLDDLRKTLTHEA